MDTFILNVCLYILYCHAQTFSVLKVKFTLSSSVHCGHTCSMNIPVPLIQEHKGLGNSRCPCASS